MAKKKTNTTKTHLFDGRVKIDNSLEKYGNHPFFVKLHQECVAIFEKYGMPKELKELIAKDMARQ